MNLKTFRGSTMADALAEVKKGLGADAYILHTRTHRVGGVLGLFSRQVVEITASDAPPRRGRSRGVAPSPPSPRALRAGAGRAPSGAPGGGLGGALASRAYEAPGRPAGPPVAPNPPVSSTFGADRPAPPPTDRVELSRERADRPAPPRQPVRRAESAGEAPETGRPGDGERLSVRRTGVPLRTDVKPALDEDIACMKRMLAQVLQTTRRQSIGRSPAVGSDDGCAQLGRLSDPLSDHYLLLLEGAVAAEIAEDLIGAVRDELTPAELGDESIVRQAMLRHLARMIPACREAPKAGRQEDGRAKTIALIGPTGVGKTTTVAKLAASYKLRHGKRVGLVTTDTYRIAAVDQLRMYANIIGVPLKVAMTPEEMSAAVQSMSDMDAILIDTAGRSQRDAERLQELMRFIDAARPHETHLVLASTSHESVLVDAARQFARLSPNRMIFTKLDEAVNFGILLNVARRVELELSYVTTGQEVPDHIEVGSPDRLARLVLEGGRRVGVGA